MARRTLSRRKATAAKARWMQGTRLRCERLEPRLLLSGFTAYNDTVGGTLTHPNATTYADNGGDSSGQLKDIETGAFAPVHLATSAVGVNFGGTGANPAAGTDAGEIFGGYVDFRSSSGNNSLEIQPGDSYTYRFSDLDPGNTYEFAGTAVRGSDSYTNRWTLVTLIGADSFTPAHSTGDGIVTDGLEDDQAALWAGANHRSNQGWVVQWTEIDAGGDGEFEVVSTQYRGPVPTWIHSSGVADGSKGYALNGIRLIENVPTAPPSVINTPAASIHAFTAEIGGEITNTGGQAPQVTIYYGDEDGGTDPLAWDHSVDLGKQTGAFSEVVGGLSQNTTYWFTSFAENAIGSAWAPSSESFTTLLATAPSVVNLAATNVGAFSAILNGEVTDTGNDPPLVTICYGDEDGGTDPGNWDDSVNVGVQPGSFAGFVDGLDPVTAYYFTAYAQNAVGGDWATPSLSFTTTDTPPLVISEFMADNATVLYTRTRDSEGQPFVGDQDSPDWIEVYNPTDAVAVLDGLHLTDDLASPTRWEFPAGTSIDPGGFMVVFASGDDITDPDLDENGYLHTDFKLKDEGGEDLALTDANGVVVFAYEDYPVQAEDVSYGVGSDGQERFFPAPTPGWDNANDIPQAPEFTVAGSTFSGSIEVDLTPKHPTDAIHYTLDESVPNASSPVWPGAMTITDTTMVRAVSIGTNGKSSRVVSEAYIELGSDMLDDNSNLPMVIVETFGDGVPGKSSGFGDCFIAVIEPGGDGRTRLTDSFVAATRGGIHVRGSSSAGFTKKQYRVEFWDESNEDRKIELLGMPGEADWIFYGPGQYDRALISNPFIYDLSNQVGRYAVRTRWVEMYLNAGGGQLSGSDYYGAFAIMEVIEQGDDRVDIERLSSGAGGVPVHGGFAWKKDKSGRYVEPENPNSAQRSYIDGYINALESAATGPNFTDPDLGYAAYADVESFIDHNLLNMLAMNVDALRISAYYYKTEEGKLEAGPIWDFDRALDSTDGRDNNPSWWYGTGDSTRYFNDDTYSATRSMRWWSRVFDDPDFVQKYIDRWFELRENEFSLANVNATIDAHAADLQEAGPRDYTRWYSPRYGGFSGEIQHMKDWLTTRINWIDGQWVRRPTFSIAGPVVTPGTTVTLSAPVGTIHYTLDGTDPRAPGGGVSGTAGSGPGPITISEYTKITARVYRPGYVPSSGEPGYVGTGDDWSAPVVSEYFVNPLVASGDVVLSEINYHPFDATPDELATQPPDAPDFEADDFEFIELENVSEQTVNLSGVTFTDGVEFGFDSHVLAPGEQIVVVENLEAFTARYGIDGSLEGTPIAVAGEWKGGLRAGGEQMTLAARDGATVLDFAYDDSAGWPGRADGKGASLELIDPSAVPQTEPERTEYLHDPDNWRSSSEYGGTPGTPGEGPRGDLLVNEVLTNTPEPVLDAIELYNTTDGEITIGGWYLSDSWGWESNPNNGNYKKYRIPDGTKIGAGKYLVFDEDEFNPSRGVDPHDFALDGAHGDDVWLMEADTSGKLTRFVDHVDFMAAKELESLGRWPNGQGELYPMTSTTLDEENSGPRVGPVIISEIHYNPGQMAGADDLEFIEIYNPTCETIDLTNWRIRKGIDFDFAPGTILWPCSPLWVLPFDPQDEANADEWMAFCEQYALDADEKDGFVGGYANKLDNGGERVQLQHPDAPIGEFIPHFLEDEVAYDDEAPWPLQPDGAGDSLNRLQPDAWGNDAASWVSADPSPNPWPIPPPEVKGRHIFYNNSAFDGNDPAANENDEEAIAEDKEALRPMSAETADLHGRSAVPGRQGETSAEMSAETADLQADLQAGFVNYTSYHRGINGIIVDIANPWAMPTAGDFSFRVGNSDDPSGWAPAPNPAGVTVERWAGVGCSHRVTIIWPDHAIRNQWLQVTVHPDNLGLPEDDVFYFGNAVGESGNSGTDAIVDETDVALARSNPCNFFNPAEITDRYDFDRDGRVGTTDMLIARSHQTDDETALKLINLSGEGGTGRCEPLLIATSLGADSRRSAPGTLARDAVLAQAPSPQSAGPETPLAKLTWLYDLEPPTTPTRPSPKPTTTTVDKLLAVYWS